MALPAGFNIHDPRCPKCSGPMWSNLDSDKPGPTFRCKDKSCKTDKGYVTGVFLTPAEKAAAKANGAAPPSGQAQAPASGGQRLSQDEFILATQDLTFVLLDHALKACLALKLDVPHHVLYEQVSMTVRQAWIEHERGVVRLGPEPAAPPAPMKAKDRYKQALFDASDAKAVRKLVMEIGGNMELDGSEKDELAEYADQRLSTLSLADQLPNQ